MTGGKSCLKTFSKRSHEAPNCATWLGGAAEDYQCVGSFAWVSVMLYQHICGLSYSRAAAVNHAGVCLLRRWSERSPSGQNVDCTTPTSSKCCKLHPYSKVSISPGGFGLYIISSNQGNWDNGKIQCMICVNLKRPSCWSTHLWAF